MRWRRAAGGDTRPPLTAPGGTRLLVFALLPLAVALLEQPRLSFAAGLNIFEVRKFGAQGDGKALDTGAIQSALDACDKAGGGTVKFSQGTYLSKPIFLHSRIRLELDAGATILATEKREDYLRPDRNNQLSSTSFHALINGKGLTDVTISGKGTIDGSGGPWWIPAKEAKRTNKENPGYTLPRPRLVQLVQCTNLVVEEITLQNSPSFHLVPAECEQVMIRNVTILAPADSPNTDGIDPSVSRDVTITGCRIDVGDDNIAVKSGKSMGSEFACENLTITDCLFQHGHGLSIGSETVGGVRNLKVERCRFEHTQNGIRIKSPRGRGGKIANASYSDISMTDVEGAITVTCYYPKIPASDAPQAVGRETPSFNNLVFKNIKATSVKDAGVIVGLPESLVQNVILENVEITAAKAGLLIRNAKGVQFINSRIKAGTGPAIIRQDAEVRESASAAKSAATGCDTSEAWNSAKEILSRIHPPDIPKRDFSITDYGPLAGSRADATEAIKKAIGACAGAGGGRVIVPTGEFFTGAIHLKSKVELHLQKGAILKFSTDPKAFLPMVPTRFEGMECWNYSPLLYAYEARDIAVTGEGTLDGQADSHTWWPWKGGKSSEPGTPNQNSARSKLVKMVEGQTPVEQRKFGEGSYLRPGFVETYRCQNVLIEGVKIRRSPMWELHPCLSTNVIVRGVDIMSHGPNNDGCDPESCRDVLIENCSFDTGDDCIAIKSGRNNDGRRVAAPAENIIVRGCTMKDGHGGVVIGSEISGGCRNVFAEDCQMDSPHLERVLRLKSNAVRGGTIENIFMRNVRVGRVADAVLQIDFLYEEGRNGKFPPIARNVVMQNIEVGDTPRVLQIGGFPEAKIEAIRVCDSSFERVKSPDRVEGPADVKLIGCKVQR